MKKKQVKISSPDDLNKNLSYNSPITWVVLGLVILLLAGFFAWSIIYKIQIKLFGTAIVSNGDISLTFKDESKLNELKDGQIVYFENGTNGTISFIDDSITIKDYTLSDNEYSFYVVIKELRPIEFWFNNQ